MTQNCNSICLNINFSIISDIFLITQKNIFSIHYTINLSIFIYFLSVLICKYLDVSIWKFLYIIRLFLRMLFIFGFLYKFFRILCLGRSRGLLVIEMRNKMILNWCPLLLLYRCIVYGYVNLVNWTYRRICKSVVNRQIWRLIYDIMFDWLVRTFLNLLVVLIFYCINIWRGFAWHYVLITIYLY